jgi:peptidoglycan/LPS O-acetylase OafA/YrhL
VIPGWTHGRTVLQGVPGYQGPYKTVILSVSCFWLAAYCFGRCGLLQRAFSWSPLRYLGNMSYSYYLVHGVTLKGVAAALSLVVLPRPHFPALYAGLLVAGFCATWLSSSVLFLTVEKPFSLTRRSASEGPFRRLAAVLSWRQERGAESATLVPVPSDKPGGVVE